MQLYGTIPHDTDNNAPLSREERRPQWVHHLLLIHNRHTHHRQLCPQRNSVKGARFNVFFDNRQKQLLTHRLQHLHAGASPQKLHRHYLARFIVIYRAAICSPHPHLQQADTPLCIHHIEFCACFIMPVYKKMLPYTIICGRMLRVSVMYKTFLFLLLANVLFSASVIQGLECELSEKTTECVSDQKSLKPHNTLSTTILALSCRVSDDCCDYFKSRLLDYTNSIEVYLSNSITSEKTLHLYVRKLPYLEEIAPNAWADITYMQNGSEHTLQLLRTCRVVDVEKNLYEISLFLSGSSEQTSSSPVKILTTCGEIPSQRPFVTESFCAQYNALSASITSMLWVSLPLTKEVSLTLHTSRDALHKVTLQSSCMEDKCHTFFPPPTPIVPQPPCTDLLCFLRDNCNSLSVSAFNSQEVKTCWVLCSQQRTSIEVLAPKTVGWPLNIKENSSVHLATCSINSPIMGRTFKFKFTVFAQKTESEEGFENYTVFSKGSDPQDVVPVAYFKTPCNEPLTTVACAGVNITYSDVPPSNYALCTISQNTQPQNAFSIITVDGSIVFRQNDKNTSVIRRGIWA